MSVIVSILSDQLIPNVLFIKQMSCPEDRHVFLSSIRMEEGKKSEILADSLRLRKAHYQVLELEPNRQKIILDQLLTYEWPEGTNYIVNITGGTKMMSQAVYLFFAQIKSDSCRIYYWPITGAPLQKLFPDQEEIEFSEVVELDLKTYFRAHGFDYKKKNKLVFPYTKSAEIFDEVVKRELPEEVEVIKNAQSSEHSVEEKVFFSGGWFEEWLYGFLKRELKLPDQQIGFGLEIKSRFSDSDRKNDNELDVAFVYKNRLYIWECKVFYSRGLNGKKISDPIYKVASIRQNLGLQATSLVAIMTPLGKNHSRWDFLNDLCRLMHVKKVYSLESLRNRHLFIKEIKKLIGYDRKGVKENKY